MPQRRTNNPTRRQHLAAKSGQTTSSSPSSSSYEEEENHTPNNPQPLTRQPSSSYSTSTPTSSLRASLNNRISSWRTNASNSCSLETTEGEEVVFQDAATSTSDEDLIASLDALALSQHEREVLARMQLVCRSARVARERRQGGNRMYGWSYGDVDESYDIEPGFHLRLRGGGDDDEDVRPSRTPRRRTTLPASEPLLPKADSERPHRVLWWFAGGRKGKVPSLGELRVRKEVEVANRREVGFWGTVLGVRRVGRVGVLGDDGGGGGDGGGSVGEVDGDAGGSGGVVEDGGASLSHGSKSVRSVVGAAGGGGGDSLASSCRGREVEADQPVNETKAESVSIVASADAGPEDVKADVVDDTADDHKSTRSGDKTNVGVEEPKARSESAKSVAEDHESIVSGDMTDAGEEKLKAKSESAKSVVDDHESTESKDTPDAGHEKTEARFGSVKSDVKDHESTRSRNLTDAGNEESKARSESAKSVAGESGKAEAEAESVRSREDVAETETTGEEETKPASDD